MGKFLLSLLLSLQQWETSVMEQDTTVSETQNKKMVCESETPYIYWKCGGFFHIIDQIRGFYSLEG